MKTNVLLSQIVHKKTLSLDIQAKSVDVQGERELCVQEV